MNAHQGGFCVGDWVVVLVEGADIADGQREVWHRVARGAEGDEVEGALGGLDGGACDGVEAFDDFGSREAVFDDLFDRAHFEVVFMAELGQVWNAAHVSVRGDHLDPDAAGVEPGESAQIDDALGVSYADQDAAIAGAERVDVPGSYEITWFGGWVDEHLDCFGAFVCGDSGGQAVLWVPVYGDGEGGTTGRGVDGGLAVEIEAVAVGLWERDEHVPGRFLEHEHDGLGRDELGGEDEVALVLA